MRKTGAGLIAVLVIACSTGASLTAVGCGSPSGGSTASSQTTGSASQPQSSTQPQPSVTGVPYYFLAVHNEPQNRPGGLAEIERSYVVLRDMVARANQYNMKLTLMFSAQWADYIAQSPARNAEVDSWKASGHEISAHHHGVWHGSWDGYSCYGESEADAIRVKQGHNPPEQYNGTLEDYTAHLRQINPDIKSGCLNEEPDKKEMPDQILYGTGSGLANHGQPGVREGDNVPAKGRNEFITVGTVNGIERRWLAHYQIYQDEPAAEAVVNSMTSGVFGGVVHSVQSQADSLYAFMEFLHRKDPGGKNSKTMSEIIEGRLIGETTVSSDIINATDIKPTGPRRKHSGPPSGRAPGLENKSDGFGS